MAEHQPNARYDHGYAILRLDLYGGNSDPLISSDTPAIYVTVNKVVWDADHADAEVSRLNELNRVKGCIPFWQITRMERRP